MRFFFDCGALAVLIGTIHGGNHILIQNPLAHRHDCTYYQLFCADNDITINVLFTRPDDVVRGQWLASLGQLIESLSLPNNFCGL